MGIALDYTSRIDPAALKAANVDAVCRYLSPLIQQTAWKRITFSEYHELTSAGIQVTLNWEYAARDWMGGASAGRSHAQQAVAQAKSLTYPKGSVIVGSCDFDITRADYVNAARNYAATFASYIREGGYRPGVYGPYDVLSWVREDGLMDAFWQAGMSTAWSGGRNRSAWPDAHLRQRGHRTIGGVDTDWNDILIRPLWGGREVVDVDSEQNRRLTNVDQFLYALVTLDETADGVSSSGWSGTTHDMPLVKLLKELKDAVNRPLLTDAQIQQLVSTVETALRPLLTDAQIQQLVSTVETALRNVLLKGVGQ